jgi:hypothetical protein
MKKTLIRDLQTPIHLNIDNQFFEPISTIWVLKADQPASKKYGHALTPTRCLGQRWS